MFRVSLLDSIVIQVVGCAPSVVHDDNSVRSVIISFSVIIGDDLIPDHVTRLFFVIFCTIYKDLFGWTIDTCFVKLDGLTLTAANICICWQLQSALRHQFNWCCFTIIYHFVFHAAVYIVIVNFWTANQLASLLLLAWRRKWVTFVWHICLRCRSWRCDIPGNSYC